MLTTTRPWTALPWLGAVLFLALATTPPAAAGEAACFESWWRARLASVAADPDDLHGLLVLRQVLDLAATSRDPTAVIDELARLRGIDGLDPLVAAGIEHVLLRDDVRRGRFDSAAARLDGLGIVARFAIAGPLHDEAQALRLALEPLDVPEISLRSAPVTRTGLLPLDALLYPPGSGQAVALFYVRLARRTRVAIRWGADDRAILLVDGHEIARTTGPTRVRFDQAAAFIELARGVHRIAFVVPQTGDAWGLFVRLTAPDGGPLSGVEILADPAPERWEAQAAGATDPRPVGGRTIVGELERLVARRPHAARSLAALARELQARDLPTRDDGRPLELVRRAVLERPSDPDIGWAAATIEREPSLRRDALERMLAFDPDHVAALRRMIAYDVNHDRPDEAQALADRLRARCPEPDPFIALQLVSARDRFGFAGGMLAELLPLVDEAPRQVSLLRYVTRLARRLGRLRLARSLHERWLALDVTDREAWNGYLDLLRSAGDAEAYRRARERLVVVDPLDPETHGSLARLLLAEGDPDGAVQVIDRALALFGDRPDLLRLSAEIALALGRDGQAVAAFRRALVAGGPDDDLEQRIAELTGNEDLGATAWRMPLDQVLEIERKAPPPAGSPAAVVLHETVAYRVEPNGVGSKLFQLVVRVNSAEQAPAARLFSITYSPGLERVRVIEARAMRRDGSIMLASRSDRALLPDLQLRMWYDARVLTLAFPRLEDGDLVEICYVVRTRGPSNPIANGYYGDAHVLGGPAPVLSARVVLNMPDELPLRYRLLNLPRPAQETVREEDGRRIVELALPALPSYPEAPGAPPPTERVPYAIVGTVDDWSALGRMYAEMVRPQMALTPDVSATVESLTRGLVDRKRIVEVIYDWVIENTRYVALEFGIHALKPYDVDTVFRRRHGDCKDKATLLVAMLRKAGVPAELVLLRTRDRGRIDTSIPTFAHFNHAIVHVPFDDLWLDGTVLHFAAGEVPLPDLGALVLLVDPLADDGVRLTTTAPPRPEDARLAMTQEVRIGSDGTAGASVSVVASGADAARERFYFRRSTTRRTVLTNRLRERHPDATVAHVVFSAIALDEKPVRFRYVAQLPGFARADVDRLSAPLAVDLEPLPFLPAGPGRDVPLVLPDPFEREIEVRVRADHDLEIAELPGSRTIRSTWGDVTLATRREGSGARITIRIRFEGGTVSPDQLEEYNRFALDAGRLLAQRIVLETSR